MQMFNNTSDIAVDSTRKPRRVAGYEISVIFTKDFEFGDASTYPNTGRIMDTSRGGVCIITDCLINKGDVLNVRTDMNNESQLYFNVRWVKLQEDGKYICGCEMINYS